MEGMAKAYWKASSKILPEQTEKYLRSLVIMTVAQTTIQIKFSEPHASNHAFNKLLHVFKVYLAKHYYPLPVQHLQNSEIELSPEI
jgi:hypothetical protein